MTLLRLAVLAAAVSSAALLATPPAPVEGSGEGAIVTAREAPIYPEFNTDVPFCKLKRGDSVGGLTQIFPNPAVWKFETWKQRVRVVFFRSEKSGQFESGWMDARDLAPFAYEGGCDPGKTPFVVKGGRQSWNPCFVKARDARLAKLKPEWEKADAAEGAKSP